MKKLKSYLVLLLVATLSLFTSCSQDDYLMQEQSLSRSNVNYAQLVEKYGLSDVTDNESIEKAQGLEAITPEKLDEILSSTLKSPVSFSLSPSAKSTRSKVVVVTGDNQECRVDVHLDVDAVEVVTTEVFYKGLMDIFLVYSHSSASTEKSGDVIDFTCKGEVLVKIIWQGIELKRVPVTIKGNYNVARGVGELTFY